MFSLGCAVSIVAAMAEENLRFVRKRDRTARTREALSYLKVNVAFVLCSGAVTVWRKL
jgi:hypothetical protein